VDLINLSLFSHRIKSLIAIGDPVCSLQAKTELPSWTVFKIKSHQGPKKIRKWQIRLNRVVKHMPVITGHQMDLDSQQSLLLINKYHYEMW